MNRSIDHAARQLAVVLAAIGLPGVATAAQPGLTCKPSVTGVGKHKTRPVARNLALKNWYALVEAAHGAAYARWGSARSRSLTCVDNPVPGTLRWTCTARALPCRIKPRLSPHRHRAPRPKSPPN